MNWKSLCLAGAALLAGCADMGGLAPHGAPRGPGSVAAARTLAGVAPASWPAGDWWRRLGDTQLDALIREALRDSPDLAAAEARVRYAAAQAGTAAALRLPTLDANASFPTALSDEHFPRPVGAYVSAKQINLAGGYDFDLWGGKRAAWEAALGRQRAAEVDAKAAELTLSTQVAQAYAELDYAFSAHDVARADLERAEKLLELTRQRVQAGIDSLAMQRQAESGLAGAEQTSAQAAQRIESARIRLAVLLGQGPDRGLAIERPRPLDAAELAVPENLPAELLGRRPDIVAARWRVEAARSEIDAAKAQFFPNVSLSAFIGLLSAHASDLFDAASRFSLATPAVSLPLFDGGRRRANLDGRDAEYDLAVAQYDRTLIAAFNEVAENLSQLRSLRAQLAAQEQSLASARQAWDLSMQRYRNGVGGYLETLILQQALHQAEDRLSAIQSRRIEASIGLVRALGGGFRAEGVPFAAADLAATPENAAARRAGSTEIKENRP